MNTDEIRYFIAMCEHGSISHAAAELHITSQGLGASLRRFERKLGVKLFVRSSTGMVPTEAARYLESRFREMLCIEDNVRAYLGERTRSDRKRTLLGRDSALGDAIAQGVADYTREHPDMPVASVLVRDTEANIAQKFIEEGFDYRFCTTEVDALPELPRERLCRLRFVPVVSADSEWARRGSFSIDDLRSGTVLTENSTFVWMEILRLRCQAKGFEPKLRELDRDYLERLLPRTPDAVHFVKDIDCGIAPWNGAGLAILPWEKGSSLEATIVMQTTSAEMDYDLAECVRKRLSRLGYGTV